MHADTPSCIFGNWSEPVLISLQWQNGRRGVDGWGKWTRRRKWYRDAELVEVDDSQVPQELEATPGPRIASYSTANEKMVSPMQAENTVPRIEQTSADEPSTDDAASLNSTSSRFWPSMRRRAGTDRSSTETQHRPRRTSEVLSDVVSEEDSSGLGFAVELEIQKQGKDGGQWGIGDEARMNLE